MRHVYICTDEHNSPGKILKVFLKEKDADRYCDMNENASWTKYGVAGAEEIALALAEEKDLATLAAQEAAAPYNAVVEALGGLDIRGETTVELSSKVFILRAARKLKIDVRTVTDGNAVTVMRVA